MNLPARVHVTFIRVIIRFSCDVKDEEYRHNYGANHL